ncbi:hypothetical protein J4573_08400 [Actinomadura barringtoniae]|uniref:DGQHR domain-containing protein n=1 Tax=Actinomadura barringtoniae TaxID=1427535 RepID=A0A939PEM1_9ACTN|nr:hypothetical protein [Actinomadura barringtoniae]MBO2447106.1 hypothetical protein [Actinomadura barringtoniae]
MLDGVRPAARQTLRRIPGTKQDWVAPALLARDAEGCSFEKVDEHGAVGYLTVPWAIGGISSLRSIDGQHRVLGVAIEKQRITDAIAAIDRDMARKVSPEKVAKLRYQPAGTPTSARGTSPAMGTDASGWQGPAFVKGTRPKPTPITPPTSAAPMRTTTCDRCVRRTT